MLSLGVSFYFFLIVCVCVFSVSKEIPSKMPITELCQVKMPNAKLRRVKNLRAKNKWTFGKILVLPGSSYQLALIPGTGILVK